MNIGNVDTQAVLDLRTLIVSHLPLFGLHTFGKGHCLSLYLTVGVEYSHGLHTLVGWHDGGEAAVGIILEFLDSHTTAKTATIWQFTGMIEEIAVSLIVGYTAMVSKRLGIAQRHNLTGISPRTSGVWCRAIADMLRHTASSIKQEIAVSH